MNIKAELVRRNLTQRELAKYLRVDYSTLSRKLNNPSSFTLEQARKILIFLDIPQNSDFAELFFVKDK